MSAFKGIKMEISTKRQETLSKVMSSRSYIDHLDKVLKMLSSNLCEHFFILAKLAEGKRTNTDKSDNCIVLNFLAGLYGF